MRLFKTSLSEAIRLARQASSGVGPQPSQTQLLQTIQKVETDHPASGSAQLEYWLGIAWRNYTMWFVRGEERKLFLEKAVMHLERAYTLEKARSGQRWTTYACEAGALLVGEALIRNLERGLTLLESVFVSTQDYEPLLCSYAEGIYKTGDYQRAAEVATELHRRAQGSTEWKDSVPPGPMRIAAMAYRAEVKGLKKDGKVGEALLVSEKLLATGAASDNDRKTHDKLKTKVP